MTAVLVSVTWATALVLVTAIICVTVLKYSQPSH